MDDNQRFFFSNVGAYAYYTIFMKYPLTIVLSISALVYQYGLLLFQYNKDLRAVFNSFNSRNCNVFLNKYFKILRKIHLLKNVLSVPLFITVLNGFFTIYSAIEYGLNNNGEDLRIYYIELSSNVCTGTLLLCSISICSSRIPEYLSEIRTTSEFLLDKLQSDNFPDRKSLILLKRIERKQIIFLSACGFVDLQRSFLLSAFGSLVTYGILISSLH
ncbi:uncharacterized protein CEXT_523931 [Caerostris extrusa]|uniref:Gustatory receptor n=1 Tax=Caerostris extrusa TaxID=172846 RepID=A0AAV4RKU7_CAEEX|nr:uncharacterized protein CEXT_523931 [Caerostris extrusa]